MWFLPGTGIGPMQPKGWRLLKQIVEAENSSGFHAPQEALRVLGESINFVRKGQLALRPMK